MTTFTLTLAPHPQSFTSFAAKTFTFHTGEYRIISIGGDTHPAFPPAPHNGQFAAPLPDFLSELTFYDNKFWFRDVGTDEDCYGSLLNQHPVCGSVFLLQDGDQLEFGSFDKAVGSRSHHDFIDQVICAVHIDRHVSPMALFTSPSAYTKALCPPVSCAAPSGTSWTGIRGLIEQVRQPTPPPAVQSGSASVPTVSSSATSSSVPEEHVPSLTVPSPSTTSPSDVPAHDPWRDVFLEARAFRLEMEAARRREATSVPTSVLPPFDSSTCISDHRHSHLPAFQPDSILTPVSAACKQEEDAAPRIAALQSPSHSHADPSSFPPASLIPVRQADTNPAMPLSTSRSRTPECAPYGQLIDQLRSRDRDDETTRKGHAEIHPKPNDSSVSELASLSSAEVATRRMRSAWEAARQVARPSTLVPNPVSRVLERVHRAWLQERRAMEPGFASSNVQALRSPTIDSTTTIDAVNGHLVLSRTNSLSCPATSSSTHHIGNTEVLSQTPLVALSLHLFDLISRLSSRLSLSSCHQYPHLHSYPFYPYPSALTPIHLR